MKECRVLKQIDCRYLIDDSGNVFSLFGSRGLRKTPKKIKTRIEPKGYVCITVFFDGKRRFTTRLHRLVASAFLGLDLFDKNLNVHHKDQNKKNNHFSNLEILDKKIHNCQSLQETRKKEKHFFTKKEKEILTDQGWDEYLAKWEAL